tara:strand:- start:2021 stop:2692 length:672 start_codon:yes stop_codon:yes gene_type:complete
MGFTKKQAIDTYGRAESAGIDNTPGVDSIPAVGDIEPVKEGEIYDIKLTADFIWSNLNNVFTNCVIPIQNHFDANGVSIGITSAYRSVRWNYNQGGVDNSHHIYGYAVDLISLKHSSAEIVNWCISNLPEWNQLIWEFPENGDFSPSNKNCSWVHISYIEGNNPKITSLASKLPDLHEQYADSDTLRNGQYSHYIKMADMQKVALAKGDIEEDGDVMASNINY